MSAGLNFCIAKATTTVCSKWAQSPTPTHLVNISVALQQGISSCLTRTLFKPSFSENNTMEMFNHHTSDLLLMLKALENYR